MTLAAHSAAGQAAGYIFQPERALYWLARSPSGSVVGVETEDDVVVRMVDGSGINEQDKHSVSSARIPFGDRSKDLWNTLEIWLSAIRNREIPQQITFYLTTNIVLPDCIVKRLMSERSDLAQVIIDLRRAGASPPTGIASIVQAVLKYSDDELKDLLSRVKVVDGTQAASGDALRREIASLLHLPTQMPWSDLLNSLGGWVTEQLLTQWRAHKPGIIARDAFDVQYQRLLTQHQQRTRRADPAHKIHLAVADIARKRRSMFVRQLRCIALADRDKEVEEAICDFLRCSSERLRLSRIGEVTSDEWIAFDRNLERKWRLIARRLAGQIAHQLTDEQASEVGYRILLEALEHLQPLGGVEQEPYITSGGFHRLADEERVYWNPRRPWKPARKGPH